MQQASLARMVASATQLNLRAVESTLQLLQQEATVPFIARYRKGQTGGLDEEQIRQIQKSWKYYEELAARKQTVLAAIEEQGKLTPELLAKISDCQDANQLEDIYLPYKKKRKTKASIARENGLEPLAGRIRTELSGSPEEILREFIQGEVCTPKEALSGAQYIIAEEVAEDGRIREMVRLHLKKDAWAVASKKETDHPEADKFELYFEFELKLDKLKPHQILALNRGESLKILNFKVDGDNDYLLKQVVEYLDIQKNLVFFDAYQEAVKMGLQRYLMPSIEREIRNELTKRADQHAIKVFAENLRQLLLQPPFVGKTVLGVDPGFASGCKLAVIDQQGLPLETSVIYPTPPRNDRSGANRVMRDLFRRYPIDIVAIGNGTASREAEQFVAQFLSETSQVAKYLIVNEAGASVYSASEVARKEFPTFDATERGTISIARRVQDPLAELIKIDPKSIGVGLYQHDVDQNLLAEELKAVVESVVNHVGVDVNTASAELLSFVSGLNKRTASNIVMERERLKGFRSRQDLLKVNGLGEKAFEQAAGFLRIRNGAEPLDNTAIHPETYPAVRKLFEIKQLAINEIGKISKVLNSLPVNEKKLLPEQIGVDGPTFELILENLAKPGRDPREDLEKPLLRSDVLKLEDLSEGMTLQGTVRNVVDFGAFVDIGLKNDALIHISEIGKWKGRRITNPNEFLSVGDILDVSIQSIDYDRNRVGLSIIK